MELTREDNATRIHDVTCDANNTYPGMWRGRREADSPCSTQIIMAEGEVTQRPREEMLSNTA